MADPFANIQPQNFQQQDQSSGPFANIQPERFNVPTAKDPFAGIQPEQFQDQNPISKFLNAVGQPLQYISNAYELGVDVPQAIARKQLPELWEHVKKNDLAGATEEFGAGSKGELDWEATHGTPDQVKVAKQRQESPKINAVMTAGEEALNPLNYAGKFEVMGAKALFDVLGGVVKSTHSLPAVGKYAVASTDFVAKRGDELARMFNKYHGIAQSDPVMGESLYRVGELNIQKATQKALEDTQSIFDNTTMPEMMEIVRRSQGLTPKVVPVSQGVDLDQRSQSLRQLLLSLDASQKQAGLLDDAREFDPSKFFPMSRPETYEKAPLLRTPSVEDYLKTRRGPGTYSGAPAVRLGTAGATGKHKIYEDLDQAIASGKLGKDFNPIVNLYGHLAQRYQDLAVEDMLGNISKQTDLIAPIEFEHKGVSLGFGKQGFDEATKYANKIMDQRATATAMNTTGYMPGRIVGTREMQNKLREAQAARQTLGKLANTGIMGAQRVLKRAEKALPNAQARAADIADPAYRVAKAIDNSDTAWQKRITDISNKMMVTKLNNVQRLAFQRAKQEALKGMSLADIRNSMRKTPANPNHVDASFEALLRTGSKFTQYSSVDVELAHLLEYKGATPEAASGIAQFVTRLNQYRRIGLVSNPVFHLLWNLPMNYMAGGGNPLYLRYLADGLGGQHSAEYAHWEKLSEQFGAHSTIPGMGASVNRVALRTMNPSQLNLGQKIVRQTDRFADWNNYVTFQVGERRMATALFRSFVDKGMTMEKAGIQVRKTLGDFANMNPDGLDRTLMQVFNFAPWLKTIIPLYAKAAVTNPYYVEGLGNVIQNYNEQQGQDRDYTRPYDIKDENGGSTPLPVPQKIMGDILNGPPGLLKIAMSHFGVGFNELAKLASTATEDAKPPSEANYNTLYDKDAPLTDQLGQTARSIGEDFVPPTAQQAIQLLRAAMEGKGDKATRKGIGAVTGLESFPHSETYPAYQRLLKQRDIAIGEAMKRGDRSTAEQLYRLYQPILKQLGGDE